jgi:hypothetical protein
VYNRDVIGNESAAKEVIDLMLDIGASLDHSLLEVQDRCSPDEFAAYRRVVGNVMGEILVTVLNPLCEQHPALKPPQLQHPDIRSIE